MKGEQAQVGISGRNAQLVVSCALNPKTGRCITLQHKDMNSEGFEALLRKVRKAYGNRSVYMLLDQGNLHTAKASLRLAEKLNVTLIRIPKQHSELNCADQLWRSMKADVSANYQYETIQQHAQAVEDYVHSLTKKQVLTKAGVLSKRFWLKEKM